MTARANRQTRREARGATVKTTPRPRPALPAPIAPKTPRPSTPRSKPARASSASASSGQPAPVRAPRPSPTSRAKTARAAIPPSIAPCDELAALSALHPAAARDHVDAVLHAAMPAAQADAFGARGYRWELHLVALDQLHLLRAVDLVPSRIRRYRAAFRRGASCTPLIGLGGEGKSPAENVLLCDGYHRAVALRDAGIHFAWVWLAVSVWRDVAVAEPVA